MPLDNLESLHLPPAITACFEGWDGGLGAIDGNDATFIYNLIRRLRPQTLVEIGTASGFSTALMAKMLKEEGLTEARLASYDLAARFFLDRSKPLGYLIDSLASDATDLVKIHSGHTSLSATNIYADGSVDFAFIDANHRHPWPLIDALMFLPRMSDDSVMVFHDPMAIRLPSNRLGTGPKVVMDSVSPDALIRSDAILPEGDVAAPKRQIDNNIFGFRCSAAEMNQLAVDLSDGFLMPWTLTNHMDLKSIMTITAFLAARYPAEVADKFRWAAERHFAPSWA